MELSDRVAPATTPEKLADAADFPPNKLLAVGLLKADGANNALFESCFDVDEPPKIVPG